VIYQNYHKHTDYTNIIRPDSACTYESYAKRATELGHGIISSAEHGWQSNYLEVYKIAKKYNLKFIFGSEAYWVKDRKLKDRTNCHICLFAKNEAGRREINGILSEANISGYYQVPRLDLPLLYSLSRKNVFITTACVAFFKYGLDETLDTIVELSNYFEDNFMLEVQNHNMQLQKVINRELINLHKKYEIPIIMGIDSHYINPEDYIERDNVLAAKNIFYENENDCILDYPDGDVAIERFQKQKILTDNEIELAINNTNIFLQFEDIEFNKDIKIPSLHKTKTIEEKNKIFTDLINVKWNEYKENVPVANHAYYEEEINKEVDCVVATNMSDYFLYDYEMVQDAVKNGGRITLSGRGSSASYFTNTLLGFSKIDRITSPVKMYPERFMSKTRILETKSIPDLDLNTGNPDVFMQAQKDLLGEDSVYQMIAFGKFKVKSAFKLYARAKNLDFTIANNITKALDQFELDYKHSDDDIKSTISVYDYVDKEYHSYIKESEKYQNIISDKKPAPCSSLIFQGNIKEEIGILKIKGKNGKKDVLVTVIDGSIADEFKYVKNDLLAVDVVNIIYDTFEAIEEDPFPVDELIKRSENDMNIWDIYAQGKTVCLNQVEKDSTRQKIMRYKPKNISELTSFIAAIRPSFQSMYPIFENRDRFKYGIKIFDDLLQTKQIKDSFLLYQEQVMATLNFAGISNNETYGIIKAIAKKKIDKVIKWKEIFIEGFSSEITKYENISRKMAFEKANQVWKIINDSSRYSFNASHAFSVACDSLYCAYFKAHHPLAFFKTVLNYYADKGDKDKITAIKKECEFEFGISIDPIMFGNDNRKFTANVEEKKINESLPSIKFMNRQIAKELFKLNSEKFDTIIDVFDAIHSKTSLQCNQIEILIKLDYFTLYGNINYIYHTFLAFRKLWNKSSKGLKKQIAINKSIEDEIDQKIIEKYSRKTEKTYMDLDAKSILKESIKQIKVKDLSLNQKLKLEFENLGYIRYKTNKKIDRHKVYILDIIYGNFDNCNPHLEIYSIGTGKTAKLKIKRRLATFKIGCIIHITKLEHKFKYKLTGHDKKGNPQFEQSKTEKEWWIEKWKKA